MENAGNDGPYLNIISYMTIQYQIHNSFMLDRVIQRFVPYKLNQLFSIYIVDIFGKFIENRSKRRKVNAMHFN